MGNSKETYKGNDNNIFWETFLEKLLKSIL